MVEPITINVKHLAQDVRIPQEQVQTAIELLDAGFPIPFIARYRKDATKDINEESLRIIDEELRTARALCERKLTILKTIESAGQLTPELDKSIRDAKSVKRLDDLYSPFKPKRKGPAMTARENGLEPFALEILAGTVPTEKIDERAAEFIDADKNIKSVADVLLGTGHIIADIFGCKAEIMQKVRDMLYQHGQLVTSKIETVAVQPAAELSDSPCEPPNETEAGMEPNAMTEGATTEGDEPAAELSDSPCEPPDESEAGMEPSAMTEGAITEGDETEAESEESCGDSASGECKPSDSHDDTNDTDEVTALFEQLQEAQAEKGIPKIISQNTLRKRKRAEEKKKLDAIKQRQREHFGRQFAEYFDFSVKLRGVQAHRILAFNRGEKHKVIKVDIKVDEAKVFESVKKICIPEDHIHSGFLAGCLHDTLRRNVIPALTREIRDSMTEYAEKSAVTNCANNLRHLFLQPPFLHRRVLALDPGGKHGCQAVALDEFGNLIGHTVVFLGGSAGRRADTAKTLAEMVQQYHLSAVAIGIGGGERIAEEAVSQMIETHFADSDMAYLMVSRAGSIHYSTSPLGKEELPNADPFVRATVSLGRRLQNPLNELVKIEPTSLCQGMLQHDIRGKHINQMLAEAVESCVNFVGVDLNQASAELLTHVSGLNLMTARRIYEYRREHGAFRTRQDLRNVPGINETIYNHASGFLRVFGGDNPLDATNIHPENYELAASIVERLGFAVHDLRSSEKAKMLADKIVAENIGNLTTQLSSDLRAGPHTVKDILEEFAWPGRDPRNVQPPLNFRKKVLKLEDMTPGLELTGTILNVTDFGAFADIGLPESGFIHISQIATGYIQNAHERLSTGNVVRLWVVEADNAKKRVSLSLLRPGIERQPPGRFADSGQSPKERVPRDAASRPPRTERERRTFSERPSERTQGNRPQRPGDSRGGGGRFDKRSGDRPFDRAPKTFVTTPIKKEVKPITEEMKKGKEPMRSFSDLAQLFGHSKAGDEG